VNDSEKGQGAVLITGTSTGIGKATAHHLDRLGFRVFATVRNEADASAIESDSSERLKAILMDVTDGASIDAARVSIAQAVGDEGLLGLVNNAGVGFTAPLEFAPLDRLRWLFDVNLFGVLAVTQAFLPLLRQGQGRIANISSTASLTNAPFHGPYTSTKLGLNGLSNCLRLELRPYNVSVSVIICGSIKTPIWTKAGTIAERVGETIPPRALALYGDAWEKLVAYFTEIGANGQPPEAAARAIAHALTAKRPRQTYFVGPDARLYNVASKLLFGRLRDWVILRATGVYS
jgi:NAD(P)-dependent dehydrogenase (short-subunit alcohol dehydrogenase family)